MTVWTSGNKKPEVELYSKYARHQAAQQFELLNTREAALFLSCTEAWLISLRKQGLGPKFIVLPSIGRGAKARRYRYSMRDLVSYVVELKAGTKKKRSAA